MVEQAVLAARVTRGWHMLGVCMVALVWWGCLTPSPPDIPQLFPQFDKLEHFTAYLALAAWFAAIHVTTRRRMLILVLLICMGGMIEILQGYTGRDAEWLDWLADIAGVLLGLAWPALWLRALYQQLIHVHAEAH